MFAAKAAIVETQELRFLHQHDAHALAPKAPFLFEERLARQRYLLFCGSRDEMT